MTAALGAFGLVFLAELGDKSMLMAMVLAPRYGPWRVITAIALEAVVAMALAVLLGGVADSLLPRRTLALVAAGLFIAFGLWALRDEPDEGDAVEAGADRHLLLVIGALAALFFVSELGDKTQVAALSLSSLNPGARIGVWAGASAGMVAADAVAVAAGGAVSRRLPRRMLARGAGAVFIAVGVVTGALALT